MPGPPGIIAGCGPFSSGCAVDGSGIAASKAAPNSANIDIFMGILPTSDVHSTMFSSAWALPPCEPSRRDAPERARGPRKRPATREKID